MKKRLDGTEPLSCRYCPVGADLWDVSVSWLAGPFSRTWLSRHRADFLAAPGPRPPCVFSSCPGLAASPSPPSCPRGSPAGATLQDRSYSFSISLQLYRCKNIQNGCFGHWKVFPWVSPAEGFTCVRSRNVFLEFPFNFSPPIKTLGAPSLEFRSKDNFGVLNLVL